MTKPGTYTVYELPKYQRFTHDIKAYDTYGKLVLHVGTRGSATQIECEALEKRGFVKLKPR